MRIFEVEKTLHGQREDLPKEEIFEKEQELLKKVQKTKKGLLEGRWIVKNKQSFSQPSFLKPEIVDGKISLNK